jgi:hypothetical protein
MGVVVQNKSNTMPTYSSAKAKIVNNPIGAVAGAVGSYYLLTKYSPLQNIWLKGAIAIIGGVTGAYLTSSLKRIYK